MGDNGESGVDGKCNNSGADTQDQATDEGRVRVAGLLTFTGLQGADFAGHLAVDAVILGIEEAVADAAVLGTHVLGG